MKVTGHLQALGTSPPGKELTVPIGWEAGWAPELVWTWWRREKIPSLPLPGTEPQSSIP